MRISGAVDRLGSGRGSRVQGFCGVWGPGYKVAGLGTVHPICMDFNNIVSADFGFWTKLKYKMKRLRYDQKNLEAEV